MFANPRRSPKYVLAALVTVLLAGCQSSSDTAASGATCSNETLSGTYLYFIVGRDRTQTTEPAFFREAGMESYDGNGNVVNVFADTYDTNGKVTGVYNIEPNCEGTAEYYYPGGSNTYRLYVDPTGERFTFVDVTGGNVKSGENFRVSPHLIVEEHPSPDSPTYCTTATLSGTYIYKLNGTDMTIGGFEGFFGEAGMESFDGKGNLVSRYTDSWGETGTLQGTYEIGPDCVGTATYGETGKDRIFVAPSGDRFVSVDIAGTYNNAAENKRVSRELLVK